MTRTQPPWVYDFLSLISEQRLALRFRFRCSCGALIETPSRKETCWNCGRTAEIWCPAVPKADQYVVRVSKRRPHWNVEEWATGSSVETRNQQQRRSSDYFGLFLIALFSIVCFLGVQSARTKLLQSQQDQKQVTPDGRTVTMPKRLDNPGY